ncbi:LacI family DNA-binding transcriptional regulator [Acuticoccus kandeliae]|uniref:LacI family DNA-binding transcriptional regulator n=1 Tax=Acuticoccus kandeliae TaxID=2073160 RepID=UPI000D3EC596|nr:LacI family DNA-binding transcriptional regulator [Acuticoccus kandeliae]
MTRPPPKSGKKAPRAPAPRPTMRKVAIAAGVSVMSVSNVVNGRFDLLRPDTRQRIEEAIAKVGYRPHAGARNLRRSRAMTVGLLIIDQSGTFLGEPFIAQIAGGLSATLGDYNYGMLLQASPTLDVEDSLVFEHGRTDAVCVFLEGSDGYRAKLIERLSKLDQPIIAFQEVGLRNDLPNVCVIRQHDLVGGQLIAQHVRDLGAKRFAVLTPGIMRPGASQRLIGIREGLGRDSGEKTCAIIPCGDMSFASTQAALLAFLADNPCPDAFLSLNDHMGIATVKLMKAQGLRVPQDVMVTGFNNMEFRQYADPLLTTITSHAYEMGAVAAKAILYRLEHGRFEETEIVLPVDLVVGGSTVTD